MTYVPYHQGGHILDAHLIRSTAHPYDGVVGDDELSQVAAPIGVSRGSQVSGLLNFPCVNDPADLNLVPWLSLPRRARHRNEQARLFRQ